MLEKLYEEILLEQSLLKLILQDKQGLKKYFNELASIGVILASPPIMASYVVKFLEKNFPNLPEQAIEKIAQFIANNPQIIDLIKS
jgi:hypothetical protein